MLVMEKLWFCNQCEKEVETTVIEVKQELSVKGKLIDLVAPVRVCATCGEEIIDEELDDSTLRMFYDKYRESEHLLTSKEIRDIRTKYGLSQASFSKLLGFGEKTITRYENGSIQDVCHDNLIRLMNNTNAFIEIWSARKDALTPSENEKIESIINNARRPCAIFLTTPYLSIGKYSTDRHSCAYRNVGGERYVG